MIRQLEFNDVALKSLKNGNEYWVTVVRPNGKYTGLARNVKPFKAILIEKRKYSCNWDLSQNKKYNKTINSNSDIFYYGWVCDTEEEAQQAYIDAIKNIVEAVPFQIDDRYKKSFINDVCSYMLTNIENDPFKKKKNK